MWRWIIRVYVSFLVFVIFMFGTSAFFINVTRLLVRAGLPQLSQLVHAHVLITMFLLGVLAGQVVLGSNFTGRGWFRSKSGRTYEGFKLEMIKPFTWLMISPIFLMGVASWVLTQSESRVVTRLSFANFYRDVLMPNCSISYWKNYQLYPYCGVQLICVGIWMASIGYSLAPLVRRHGTRYFRSLRGANDDPIPTEESSTSLMKEKTESQ
jgi:hypothetical protein